MVKSNCQRTYYPMEIGKPDLVNLLCLRLNKYLITSTGHWYFRETVNNTITHLRMLRFGTRDKVFRIKRLILMQPYQAIKLCWISEKHALFQLVLYESVHSKLKCSLHQQVYEMIYFKDREMLMQLNLKDWDFLDSIVLRS